MSKMKTNVLLAVAAFSLAMNGHAQSIVRSSVGSAGSSQSITSGTSTYFISHSIGQASVIGTSPMIRQGFQQPPSSYIVQKSTSKNEYSASIYPNPFSRSISVVFEREVTRDITISVHDISGKLVHYQQYSPAQQIELSLDVANGHYMIHVIVGESRFTTSIIRL